MAGIAAIIANAMVTTMLEIALFIPLSFASSNFLLLAIAEGRPVRTSSFESPSPNLWSTAPLTLQTYHSLGWLFIRLRAPRRWSRVFHLTHRPAQGHTVLRRPAC